MTMSRGSNFDDHLSVHPWRNLIKELCDGLTDYDLRTLVFLAKDHVGARYERLAGDGNFYEFFSALEEVYGEEHVADLVENLLECAQLHDASGVKFADKIRAYKKARSEYLEKSSYRDPCFVGRESILKEILACLEPDCSYKGVALCGLGGMGKTSLAGEVCCRLLHGQSSWAIIHINLREKVELCDLLFDLVTSLDQEYVGHDMDQASLMLKLHNILPDTFVEQTLLVLDNVDGMCDSGDKMTDFCNFLQTLLHDMGSLANTCKTRLLLTLREKLGCDITPGRQTRFNGCLREFEVSGLSPEDSAQLLRKFANKDIAESVEICRVCGGSPMALRLVASLLREGHTPGYILTWLRHGDQQIFPQLLMETCFEKVVTSIGRSDMSNNLQHVFLKLSLFQTAPFDIEAAIAVAGDNNGSKTEYIPKHKKRRCGSKTWAISDMQKAQMMTNFLALKMKHLIEFVDSPGCGKHVKQFSLHPLVWRYIVEVLHKTEEWQNQYCKGKQLFLSYFSRMIDRCAQEQDCDPLQAQRLLEQNRVHIKTFYSIIMNDSLSVDKCIQVDRNKPNSMLKENSFWKVAKNLVLSPEPKKLFARGQAENALKAHQLYRYINWRCKEVEHLLEQDQVEFAEIILDKMCICFGVVSHGGSYAELKGACNDQEQADWSETVVQDEEIIPAIAMYHLVRGRIYQRRHMYPQALDSLKVAECMFRGEGISDLLQTKTGGQKLYNRQYYRSELARVVNLVGCVHFDLKQFDKSRQCHNEACEMISELTRYTNSHIDIPEYRTNIGACYHQLALRTNDNSQRRKYFERALHEFERSLSIDKQLKRDMFRCHANTLRLRADIYYQQRVLELAVKDAKQSLAILQKLVRAPNLDLTCTFGDVAHFNFKLGREKAKRGECDEATAYFKDSLYHYEHVLIHIKLGGLPVEHRDYGRYKTEHRKLLEQLNYPTHLVEKRMNTYTEIENGKFPAVLYVDLTFDTTEFLRTAKAKGDNMVITPPELTRSQEIQSTRSRCSVSENTGDAQLMVPDGELSTRGGFGQQGKGHAVDHTLADEAVHTHRDIVAEEQVPTHSLPCTSDSDTDVDGNKLQNDVNNLNDPHSHDGMNKKRDTTEKCDTSDTSLAGRLPQGYQNKISPTAGQTCTTELHSSSRSQNSSSRSQNSVLAKVRKLLTLSSRSFAKNEFIPADDLAVTVATNQTVEPARKDTQLFSQMDS